MKVSKEYESRRTTDDDSNEEGNGTDFSVVSGISNTTATNLSGRRRTGNAASTLLGNRGIFCHREIDIYINKTIGITILLIKIVRSSSSCNLWPVT